MQYEMNLKIHHIALTVRDMNESVEWYKKVFDAKQIERYAKHGLEIVHLQIGDARIELFAGNPKAQALPEYRKSVQTDIRVVGAKHVCLETDDIDALKKKLRESGVEFATEIDTAGFGGRYVFIKDPNGILIELYQS